jgi:hypothetical protein
MTDKRTRIIGLSVLLGVFAIYLRTMATTTSFWDCGEFISCAFTLGVPHPPGSPLFALLGRIFSMVPTNDIATGLGLFPDYTDLAFRVTIMSPIMGALSALFCYLVILRLIRSWRGGISEVKEQWSDQVGAVVGAFIFALADSNWFNAVEAEVYAYAIFLMVFALWLGLVWIDTIGKPAHLSLTLFLAYLMGLSWGLHLLCLLVLPSIGLLGLFAYVRGSGGNKAYDQVGDDSRETILFTLLAVGLSLFVMAGNATIDIGGAALSARWILVAPVLGAGAGIIYLSITRQRDAWILLSALGLMGLGGYFLLHAMNAASLLSDPRVSAEMVRIYGFGSDPVAYQQMSIILAILFGASGLVMTFMTKAVSWRDTWSLILVVGAAALSVKLVTGLFFFIEGVSAFPTTALVGGIICAGGAIYLSQGTVKPKISPLKSYHFVVAIVLLLVLGYSTYLVLLIRSGQDPVIDMNNPENWKNLFYMLNRKQYGDEDMSMIIFARKASFGYQFWDMLVKYIFQQFPLSVTGMLFDAKIYFRSAMTQNYSGMRIPDLPLLLAFLGMFWHLEMDRKRFLALFALFMISGIGLSVYLNMPDPQPRERHYVFTGATSVLAIWMGMGITGTIRSIRQWLPQSIPEVIREKAAPYAVAVVGVMIPVTFLFGNPLMDEYSIDHSVKYTNWQRHDRRKDTIGIDYAINMLNSCGKGGIVFTNGDNDTYPLWYAQNVLGVRRDVRVACLALLNTDWYVEQLRDNEPRLPMTPGYTDDYIRDILCGASLRAVVQSGRVDVSPDGSAFGKDGRLIGWKAKKVRAAGQDTIRAIMKDGRLLRGTLGRSKAGTLTIAPHDGGAPVTVSTEFIASKSIGFTGIEWLLPRPRAEFQGVLRIQDVMVYKIIDWAAWKRPVYFAITVPSSNRIGLDEHLQMEGMVFRVMKNKPPKVETKIATYNLDSVYKIRNVMDQTAYKDDHMKQLISNYRVCYLRLAETQLMNGSAEGARDAFVKLRERLPLDWTSAYSAATIAHQGIGRTKLVDIRADYAKAAADIMIRELGTTGTWTPRTFGRIRANARLLKMSNRPEQAAEMIMAIERLVPQSNLDPMVQSAYRAMFLYEAGTLYSDSDRKTEAISAYNRCLEILRPIQHVPAIDQAFRENFGAPGSGLVSLVESEIRGLMTPKPPTTSPATKMGAIDTTAGKRK